MMNKLSMFNNHIIIEMVKLHSNGLEHLDIFQLNLITHANWIFTLRAV